MVNPRKIYAIDTGLMRACSRSPKPDWGRLLENLVFLELRRRQPVIEYYKTLGGREVDFIVTGSDGGKTLVQAAADLTDADTRARELKALDEAMGECGINRATLVTMGREEEVKTAHGRVDIVPAWQWALAVG